METCMVDELRRTANRLVLMPVWMYMWDFKACPVYETSAEDGRLQVE
jgi:hypothetical protein